MKRVMKTILVVIFVTPILSFAQPNMTAESLVKRQIDWMLANLDLSDEQEDQVKVVISKYAKETIDIREKNRADRSKIREKMDGLRNERNDELKNILSEDQLDLYIKYQEEQARNRRRR